MSKVSESKDLLELIDNGRNNPYLISQSSIFTKIGENKIIAGGCFFDRYIDFIKNYCCRVSLTEEEMFKYKYKPKKLSYDLYKTEELWFLLLKLNNMSSEIDFVDKRRLYILEPDNLSILNRIILINTDEIEDNHTQMLMSN